MCYDQKFEVTSNDCQGLHANQRAELKWKTFQSSFSLILDWPDAWYDSQLLKWKWTRVQLCFTKLQAFQSLVDIYHLKKKGKSTNKNRSKYHILYLQSQNLDINLKFPHPRLCYRLCEIWVRRRKRLSEVRACLVCVKEHLDNAPGWVLDQSSTHEDNRSP